MEQHLEALWSAIVTASPLGAMLCGVFLYLARRDLAAERKERMAERQAFQDELTTERSHRDALLERTLTSINLAGTAVLAATAIVGEVRNTVATLAMEVKVLTRRDPGT